MATTRTGELSRITYWKNSMDHARRFMTRLMDYPVHESGEELVGSTEFGVVKSMPCSEKHPN